MVLALLNIIEELKLNFKIIGNYKTVENVSYLIFEHIPTESQICYFFAYDLENLYYK